MRKGVALRKRLKDLKYCRRVLAPSTARVAVAGQAAQFAVAASLKGSSSVLNVPIFHAQTGMKMASSRTSSTVLKRKDFRK